MADTVQNDLSDGALAGIRFHPGFIVDRLGQAILRPAIIQSRAAKGGLPDKMCRRRQIRIIAGAIRQSVD